MSYQRVTTLAKMLDDSTGLIRWKSTMAALGAIVRDDLRAQMASLEYPRDKSKMYTLADKMAEAAAASRGANLGTALHRFAERIDRGDIAVDDVPPDWRPDLVAYREAMDSIGAQVHPSYLERVCVNPELNVAGTFDRLLRIDGRVYVGDIKTGSLDYSGLAIAVQLAAYARSPWLWVGDADDVPRDRWGRYDLGAPSPSSTEWEPMPTVDQDRAVVIHLQAGEGRCDLVWVNIAEGWDAAVTAAAVRERRSWGKRDAFLGYVDA